MLGAVNAIVFVQFFKIGIIFAHHNSFLSKIMA